MRSSGGLEQELSSGENIETGGCLQQPTWTSERYGLSEFLRFSQI